MQRLDVQLGANFGQVALEELGKVEAGAGRADQVVELETPAWSSKELALSRSNGQPFCLFASKASDLGSPGPCAGSSRCQSPFARSPLVIRYRPANGHPAAIVKSAERSNRCSGTGA